MTKVYGQCDAYCKYEVLTKENFILLTGKTWTSAGEGIEVKSIHTITGTNFVVLSAMMKEAPIEGMVTTSDKFQTGYSLPVPNSGGITLGVPTVVLEEDETFGATTVKFNLQQCVTEMEYDYRILLLDTTGCKTNPVE